MNGGKMANRNQGGILGGERLLFAQRLGPQGPTGLQAGQKGSASAGNLFTEFAAKLPGPG
jgi:hypothetical protein